MRPLPLLFAAALALLSAPALAAPPQERTVVVLLFDGVAPSLLALAPVPAFERMRREGSFSHGFEPPFPTISLISGFTISTGCWPEHHGIVTNEFLDGDGARYDHSRDADWMTGCENLHQAAERQGVRSAALDWYGARSHSRGPQASIVDGTEGHNTFPDDATRAEEVAALLALPAAERPRLILAYFRGPDGAAHYDGMASSEARDAVVRMDAAVARVMKAIDAGPGRDATALVVTTDHGMAPVTAIVNIERILRVQAIPARAVSTGTTSFLYFDDPAAVEPAAQKLAAYPQFEVLRRDALPDYAHLGTGPRVAPLIVSAKPPYFIEDARKWPWALRWLGAVGPEFPSAGLFLKATHGYPPATPGMAGVLYLWGDGIAEGIYKAQVRAVDLHPTVTALLGIEPGVPVDGVVVRSFLVAEGF
jgi:predicted AlkP superfamily pyrophosphatase or phosphodiesterase